MLTYTLKGVFMKTCCTCRLTKELIEFGKDKYKSDGLNPYCKSCIRIRSAKQRKDNPEYVKKYADEYRKNNKNLLRDKSRDRFQKNRKKYLKLGRDSYLKHKEEIAKRRKIKRSSPEARKKENIRQKEWRKKNPKLYRSYIKKWQQKNKLKHCCHQRVHRAIEDGVLIRSITCEKCNKKSRTEGHHEDYHKPLDVIWLCRKCHASLLEVIEV